MTTLGIVKYGSGPHVIHRPVSNDEHADFLIEVSDEDATFIKQAQATWDEAQLRITNTTVRMGGYFG